MLQIKNLVKSFGGVQATKNVTMAVTPGEVRGIIGPNGAGKSTLFNLISGHVLPDSGKVQLAGEDVTRLAPHLRARRGVSIVFQGARLFPGMTVLENVMVGAHARTSSGMTRAILRTPQFHRDEKMIREDSLVALGQVDLQDWAQRDAALLPLGQQRRMQIARALVAQPKLLLLDEPASGLRAHEREALIDIVRKVQESGVTTLLIEHDVAMVMQLADVITVLSLGEVIAEGAPQEIRSNEAVIEAYLGKEVAHAEH